MSTIFRCAAQICLIAACLGLWFLSTRFGASGVQSKSFGPAFFPQLILAGLILVFVLQIVGSIRPRSAQRSKVDRNTLHWFDLASMLGITAGYIALLILTGFVPATLAFQIAVLFVVFRQRETKVLFWVPAGLTCLYFLVFIRGLQMPLPQGYGVFREISQIIYY